MASWVIPLCSVLLRHIFFDEREIFLGSESQFNCIPSRVLVASSFGPGRNVLGSGIEKHLQDKQGQGMLAILSLLGIAGLRFLHQQGLGLHRKITE